MWYPKTFYCCLPLEVEDHQSHFHGPVRPILSRPQGPLPPLYQGPRPAFCQGPLLRPRQGLPPARFAPIRRGPLPPPCKGLPPVRSTAIGRAYVMRKKEAATSGSVVISTLF